MATVVTKTSIQDPSWFGYLLAGRLEGENDIDFDKWLTAFLKGTTERRAQVESYKQRRVGWKLGFEYGKKYGNGNHGV
jgi:hypothetical protein